MQFKTWFEMTFSAGGQDFINNPDFSQSQKINEFNSFDVFLQEEKDGSHLYGLFRGDRLCCWVKIKPSQFGEELLAIRTLPEFRRQHLAENFLFWLKSYLQKSIIIGDTMSNDAINFLKNVATSGRFKIYWLNTTNGEKHPYNPTEDKPTLSPYRSLGEPTEWRIFIEGYKGNFFKEKFDEWNKLGYRGDLFQFNIPIAL